MKSEDYWASQGHPTPLIWECPKCRTRYDLISEFDILFCLDCSGLDMDTEDFCWYELSPQECSKLVACRAIPDT